MISIEVLISITAVLLFILYKRWSRIFNYWKERGLPHRKPYPVIGNVLQVLLKKKSLGEILVDLGNEFKDEPLIGFYSFSKPILVINDPEYAEAVLIKEFSRFINRLDAMDFNEMRPLDKHIFFLGDSAWKGVRSKTLPIFTVNKLKGMLPKMDEIFDKVSDHIDSKIDKSMEIKSLVELYTMCVRAACVFGYDVKNTTLESRFMKKVRELSHFNILKFIESSIFLGYPKLAAKLNISLLGGKNENYFADAFLRALKARTQENVVKQDLLQALLELKVKGQVQVTQWVKEDDYLKMDEKYLTTDTVKIDDDILVAQGLIFILAGFDPILVADILTMYELARNSEVLDRLRAEVDDVIDRHKEFSYDALKEMQYMDLCMKETLRLYTAADILVRRCNKSYTFDNGFTIEKDTNVYIPAVKFHMDAKYFPEPHLYKPERFDNTDYPSCAYLPFGEGPRICIGMRFAMMEMKMFLSKMIYLYDFTLNSATEPLSFDKWFFLRRVTSTIKFNFTKRTH